jgi:hypothetical protein
MGMCTSRPPADRAALATSKPTYKGGAALRPHSLVCVITSGPERSPDGYGPHSVCSIECRLGMQCTESIASKCHAMRDANLQRLEDAKDSL